LTPASANQLIDHPIIEIANLVGGNLALSGYVGAVANDTDFANMRVEFFVSDGSGEGQTYLGFLTTDANGNYSGTLAVSGVVNTDAIVATATMTSVGTSEFGNEFGVNVAPVNTVPGNQSVNEDTSIAISGVSVTDSDSNIATVQLSVGDGTISATLQGAATFSAGATGSATFTLSGSTADINATLATLSYQGDLNFNGTDTLSILTTDGGGLTDSDSFDIVVDAVNDDPFDAGSVPSDITVAEDISSDVDLSSIDIQDVDDAGSPLTVRLTTSTGGNLTATASAGITISTNGTGQITLAGTQGVLNTYLNNASNIQYLHGTPNTFGGDADTIQVEISDNGNTGSGGGGFVTLGTSNVDIANGNDAPVITGGPDTSSLTETNSGLASSGTLTVFDVDQADTVTAAVDSVAVTGTGSSSVPPDLDNPTLRGFLTVSPTAILDNTETTDTLTWNFDSGSEAFDFLAEGETLILTYTVRATDDAGTPLSDTETVTVTVTGTNDSPTISVVDVAGAVAEDATTPNLMDSGSVSFSDLDETDALNSSVALTNTTTTGPAVPVGLSTALSSGLSLTQTGTNDGSIAWDFSLANSLTQYLADGETVTATYTISVADDSGTGNDTATQDVTVVITGTNDTPTISVVDVTGAVTEDASTPNLTDSGSVTFAELDDTDVLNSSVALTNTATTGPAVPAGLSTALNSGLSLTQTGTNDGSIAWDFSVANSLTQYLAAGETVSATYTITVTDDSGTGTDTTTQDITVVISGSNDTPTISVVDVTGAVTEDASTPSLTDSGSVTFAEADDTDVLNSSVALTNTTTTGPAVPAGLSTALSTAVSLTQTGTNDGSIGWDFSVANSLIQYLADGETVTATYTITVSDDSGTGTDTTAQDVTVVITGTNDAPTIAVVDVTGAVTEDASTPNLVDSGSVTFAEVDDTDVLNSSVALTNTTTTGPAVPVGLSTALSSGLSLTQTGTNDGSIAWDFSIDNGLTQYLADGETVTATYTITVTDDSGTGMDTATEDVTIVITGTNDAPSIAGPSTTSLTEADSGLTDSGTVLVNDFDTSDLVTATVDMVSVSGSGSGGLPVTLDNATLQSFLSVTPTAVVDGTTTSGTLTWSFNSGAEVFNFLAAGDDLVLTYLVTATDDAGTPLGGSETVTVTIVGTNDGPAAAGIELSTLTYTENDPAVQVTNAINVADVDDTHIESAVVRIAGNYANGEDVLAFANTLNITGVWDASSGTLTLTGTATLADYETAIRSITYTNTSENPDTATRTVSFTVNDGEANSNTQTRDITITPVNDAPVQSTIESTPVSYTENDGALTITSTITLSDVDDTIIESAAVQITGNFVTGEDVLTFVDQNGISGSFNATSGTLTLTGTATVAQYESALRSVTYTNPSEDPSTLTRTVGFTVNDGSTNSIMQTRDIIITAVNDAPVASDDWVQSIAGESLSVDAANGLLANDSDIENDQLVAIVVSPPSSGSLTVAADGSWSYIPAPGFHGTVSFSYVASDGVTVSPTAMVIISVLPGNIEVPGPGDVDDSDDGNDDDSGNDPTNENDPDDESAIDDNTGIQSPTDSRFSRDPQNESLRQAREIVARIDANDGYSGYDLKSNSEFRSSVDATSTTYRFVESESNISSDFSSIDFDSPRPNLHFITDQFLESIEASETSHLLIAGLASSVFVGVSAGVVMWSISGSYLVSLLGSSLPIWSRFDPIHIVTDTTRNTKEDDVSLAQLISQDKHDES
jgi:VCBS repeat-containing protein